MCLCYVINRLSADYKARREHQRCLRIFADQGPVSISVKARLIVRYRKVWKPRNLYLELYDGSDIRQALRQPCCRPAHRISKRCDNLYYQYRGFETLQEHVIRCLNGYWNRSQFSPLKIACEISWNVATHFGGYGPVCVSFAIHIWLVLSLALTGKSSQEVTHQWVGASSGTYGEEHTGQLLNAVRKSASAMEAGNWFHWGMVLKIVEFQSGDDFCWALGRCNLCGLETPLGVLLDLVISTDSWGMLTNLCKILYNNSGSMIKQPVCQWCHLRFLRAEWHWWDHTGPRPSSGLPL